MSYGISMPNTEGDIVVSSDTYNLHYAGVATFFSSQRFQSYPSTVQYDNFFIQSETAPIPFVLNRPGISSAVMAVAKSETPGNWNIVILSMGGTSNLATPRGDGRYNFTFRYDPPPTILCFYKLPTGSSVSDPTKHGIAVWDSDGNLSVDSTRKLFDPELVASVVVPTPETTQIINDGGNVWYGPGRFGPPGVVYIDSGNGFVQSSVGYTTTSANTSIGNIPSNSAYFFASDAELYPWSSGQASVGAYRYLSQNHIPVVSLSDITATVRWAGRATIQGAHTSATIPYFYNTGWSRNVAPSQLIIIDADRYL